MADITHGFYVKGHHHLDEKYYHENMKSFKALPLTERAEGQLFYIQHNESGKTNEEQGPGLYMLKGGIQNVYLTRVGDGGGAGNVPIATHESTGVVRIGKTIVIDPATGTIDIKGIDGGEF